MSTVAERYGHDVGEEFVRLPASLLEALGPLGLDGVDLAIIVAMERFRREAGQAVHPSERTIARLGGTTARLCIIGPSMAPSSSPVLAPRRRVPGGCCEARVEPDLGPADAAERAHRLRALADGTRLRVLDALRKAAPDAVCQCELTPLFDISQQALSKHLKVLADAGMIQAERRGVWTYYFVVPAGLEEVRSWLS